MWVCGNMDLSQRAWVHACVFTIELYMLDSSMIYPNRYIGIALVDSTV